MKINLSEYRQSKMAGKGHLSHRCVELGSDSYNGCLNEIDCDMKCNVNPSRCKKGARWRIFCVASATHSSRNTIDCKGDMIGESLELFKVQHIMQYSAGFKAPVAAY